MNKRLRREIEEILRREGVKPDCRKRSREATRRVLSRGEQELLKSVAKTTAQLFAEVLREGMGGSERQFVRRHRAGKMRVHRQSTDVQGRRVSLTIEGYRVSRSRRRHYGAE